MASAKKRKSNPIADSKITKMPKLIAKQEKSDDDDEESDAESDESLTGSEQEIKTYLNGDICQSLYQQPKTQHLLDFLKTHELSLQTIREILPKYLRDYDVITVFIEFYDDTALALWNELRNTYLSHYNRKINARLMAAMSGRDPRNKIHDLVFVNQPLTKLIIQSIKESSKYKIQIDGYLGHVYIMGHTPNLIVVEQNCLHNCLETGDDCLSKYKERLRWKAVFLRHRVGIWRVTGTMHIKKKYKFN